jgi:hypothetical protein
MALRHLPNIRYGTEGYPEKVARRLRAANIAAWISAALAAFLAVLRLLDTAPGMFVRGLTNAAIAAVLASLPLLHRFSSLAAPLVFVGFAFAASRSIISRPRGTGFCSGSIRTAPLVELSHPAHFVTDL